MKLHLYKRDNDNFDVVKVNWTSPKRECFRNVSEDDEDKDELYSGCSYYLILGRYAQDQCNILPAKQLEELTAENIKFLDKKFHSWLLPLIKE